MTVRPVSCFFFFFFNDTATTEIYTLSLHDALPISLSRAGGRGRNCRPRPVVLLARVSSLCQQKEARRGDRVAESLGRLDRSEEHTSELQSRLHLVCRLLLEKKKTLYLIRQYLVVLN